MEYFISLLAGAGSSKGDKWYRWKQENGDSAVKESRKMIAFRKQTNAAVSELW